ncbi:MAG: TIGR02757 family protein [Ignavibacteria bacterium]
MNKKELKIFLEDQYLKYKKKYSSKDPVWNLHRFSDDKDIEIAGLITSCYSYGKVDQINLFLLKFLKNINFKVYEFTSNYSEHKDKKYLDGLNYRFNTDDDLSVLLLNIKRVINENGSLKNSFLNSFKDSDENILPALTDFTININKTVIENSYYGYLIPSPLKNSTCKRLNLYLRWMIRKDEIDPGTWSDKISTSKLVMPVDTHIYRVSRKLKLVKRKSCDMKFAVELTAKLKQFDESDPVKYDFALCHAGIDKTL